MFKKTLAIFLSVLMLVSCFAFLGCSNEGNGDETEDTTAAETERVPEPVDIASAGATRYKVIRAESADDIEKDAAIKLRRVISETVGCEVKIADDWYNSRNGETLPEKDFELLVGATNRVETANALAKIRQRDWIITFENDRVVITGGTSSATAEAVDYFIEHFVDTAAKSVSILDNLFYVNNYEYPLGTLTLDGVPLREWRVVYPEKCDKLTYNTALNLADYFLSSAGISLSVVTDKETETDYELLVGATNRAASTAAKTYADDEFYIGSAAKKVVLLGKDTMICAAAGTFAASFFPSAGVNTNVDAKLPDAAGTVGKFEFKEAKNAILIIGDGMGRNHVQCTLDTGKLDVFVADLLPYNNYAITKSYSVMKGKASYTDSAAAGTALATGYKTYNGYIALDSNKTSRKSLRELAYSISAKTSILTTDKITGATPAVFLAHQGSRNDTDEIQKQIDKVVADGAVDYCKGSVGNSLWADTRESLQLIGGDGSRFFTMIEEAYTDKGAHNNEFKTVYEAVVRINDAIAYATAFVYFHPDSVLLITADHETGGITKQADGTYKFTKTSHTNTDVPIYGLGYGVDTFLSKKVDNTEIAKFMAKMYGDEAFGDLNFKG